ncbi:hypothetical protein ZORO111902_17325 [Zobellia roscoffensis]
MSYKDAVVLRTFLTPKNEILTHLNVKQYPHLKPQEWT